MIGRGCVIQAIADANSSKEALSDALIDALVAAMDMAASEGLPLESCATAVFNVFQGFSFQAGLDGEVMKAFLTDAANEAEQDWLDFQVEQAKGETRN